MKLFRCSLKRSEQEELGQWLVFADNKDAAQYALKGELHNYFLSEAPADVFGHLYLMSYPRLEVDEVPALSGTIIQIKVGMVVKSGQ